MSVLSDVGLAFVIVGAVAWVSGAVAHLPSRWRWHPVLARVRQVGIAVMLIGGVLEAISRI